MKEINSYLFVYGTLLQKGNKFAAYLYENSSFYGKGKVGGKLYDLGQYPGIVLHDGDDQLVYGNIHLMTNPDATLKILDLYEGISEDNTGPNEYTRKLVPVENGDNILVCWIYEYNLPVDGLKHIISGDYLEYTKR
jgi:gamma-glutamylcyclotransferase (GGCT)/AIG2-like uncharacterized protein YtfP